VAAYRNRQVVSRLLDLRCSAPLGDKIEGRNSQDRDDKNVRQFHHPPLFPDLIERRLVVVEQSPLRWAWNTPLHLCRSFQGAALGVDEESFSVPNRRLHFRNAATTLSDSMCMIGIIRSSQERPSPSGAAFLLRRDPADLLTCNALSRFREADGEPSQIGDHGYCNRMPHCGIIGRTTYRGTVYGVRCEIPAGMPLVPELGGKKMSKLMSFFASFQCAYRSGSSIGARLLLVRKSGDTIPISACYVTFVRLP